MLHNTVNVVRDLSLHTILAKSIPVTETEIILIFRKCLAILGGLHFALPKSS